MKSELIPCRYVQRGSQRFACFKIMNRSALTLRRIIFVATTSAVPAVRASGRPAAGHPGPDFAAADQASDLVGRPGSAGRLGPDCSYSYLDWVEIELGVTRADQTDSIGCDENVVMHRRRGRNSRSRRSGSRNARGAQVR